MKKILQQHTEQIELDESELEQITGGRRQLPPPPPPHKRKLPLPQPQPQPTLPTQPGVPGAR